MGSRLLTPLSIIPPIKNDDMDSSLEYNHLQNLFQLGYVFALVAPQGNDDKSDYQLAHYVRGKQNLAQPITDDDGFKYPTSSVVVAGTWLRTYIFRRNGIRAFEDYQKKNIIVIYLHLIIETNVNFLKHQGRTKVKELFTITNVDHEALLETLKQREDPIGTLDQVYLHLMFFCS